MTAASNTPLLTVQDRFLARDGAIEVLPSVASDRLPGPAFEVRLVTPHGSVRAARGSTLVAHIRGAFPPKAMLRLIGVTLEDVPPGTEVWLTG